MVGHLTTHRIEGERLLYHVVSTILLFLTNNIMTLEIILLRNITLAENNTDLLFLLRVKK